MESMTKTSTGMKSLDAVINGLRMGDNVVWQVDGIADYREYALLFAAHAIEQGRRLLYIRFADHEQLLPEGRYITVYRIDSSVGFESFSTCIYGIIKQEGEGACYVFDCLTDLQSAWSSDLMIANFFLILCPYLLELNTIAYFALLRKSVSFSSIAGIRETTQVLIDVYNAEGNHYIHPLKVMDRYSPTMFFPHLRQGDSLTPVTGSVDAARLITHIQRAERETAARKLDYWDRIFLSVEEMIKGGGAREDEKEARLQNLCRIMIGRDRRMLRLAMAHLRLEDFVELNNRLIGTGFIGGKAVGMIVARKILSCCSSLDWESLQEPHDSFYIGSDVFYTFLVQNGWWKLFQEHKTEEGYMSAARELNEKMLHGVFSGSIKEEFRQIIEYFGQSPFIVRSSSLLEDAYGNAFAGKYESYFLVNQGPPELRFEEFMGAIRRIYASTMNDEALIYRKQRGLDRMDEQMALLVQRVSGSYHSKYYFPFMAGVGLSHNTYIWKNTMDPRAGMLRLVFGLGTRAVNRVEGDYPRIVALDQPLVKPQAGIEDARKYSQHYVDVLNIGKNELEARSVQEILNENADIGIERIASRDMDAEEKLREYGGAAGARWIIDFDEFLGSGGFTRDISAVLRTLEEAYEYPVDIEFTVNFSSDGEYHLNLLQCRPQQTRWVGERVEIPASIDRTRVFFAGKGNFLGGSISQPIKRIILVDPHKYTILSLSQKYEVARIVGRLNRLIEDRQETPTLVCGPGRWGTTTPSLGVPVRFSEINNIRVLVEVASMRDDLIPEFSYGTHFFQDLVETDIFYVALFPGTDGVYFSEDWLKQFPDIFGRLLPDRRHYLGIVKVYDIDAPLRIMADIISQELVCLT